MYKRQVVFHAGTAKTEAGIVTNGGRVLGVTAKADNIKEAVDKAYKAASKINFAKVHYRKDIAYLSLIHIYLCPVGITPTYRS